MANDKHLDEFFRVLWNRYERWKFERTLTDFRQEDAPTFSIGHKINGSVFSYLGYEKTDVVRDQTEKDRIAVEMLDQERRYG